MILTCRPGPVAERLTGHAPKPFRLEPTSKENQEDAARFSSQQLQGRLTDADETVLQALCEQLAEQAQGNFLVLRLFLSADSLGRQLSVADLNQARRNLTGLVENEYEKFLDRKVRQIEETRKDLEVFYSVLGAFGSALAPITPDQVCSALDLKRSDWVFAYKLIGDFLERGGIRQEERGELAYRLYHETFREFLQNRLALDLPKRHREWAEWCSRWRELKGYARLYALRCLPRHLIAASRR